MPYIRLLMAYFPTSMGKISKTPNASYRQTQDSMRDEGSRKRERVKT